MPSMLVVGYNNGYKAVLYYNTVKGIFPIFILLLIILAVTVGVNQFLTLRKAHSSFENYYAFRGCTKLLTKAPTYATCALEAGKTIKIVEVHSKWYLDGDLPVCYFNVRW